MFHAFIEGLQKKKKKKWNNQNGGGFSLGFDCADKRYTPKPEVSIENENVKVLCNMKVQTENVIEHSQQDIVVFNKEIRV